MAVTAFWYGNAVTGLVGTTAGRRINWTGDTIKVSLHTSTYTPNQDTHTFISPDLTNEIANTGDYVAGGVTLAGKTANYTAGTNTVALDANDVTWTGVTFTARYAVISDTTPGTAATNPLLGYVDFGADQTVNSGNFTITWAVDGVLKLVAA
jgi:hypothetical protein